MIDKIGRRIYYMYIEKINGPEDVKKLNIEEMTALAEEMRHALLKRAFWPEFWHGRGNHCTALCF